MSFFSIQENIKSDIVDICACAVLICNVFMVHLRKSIFLILGSTGNLLSGLWS